ncbi:MAG: SDR family oxidoreductase [Pseudomonadota bacterium]
MPKKDRKPNLEKSASMRIALVTGGGSGIGQAAALALHKAGYQVIITGRRADALEQTAVQAKTGHPPIITHPADVTKDDDVTMLFAAIEKDHSRLDVLFNNAGISAPAVPPDELAIDDWHACVAVNLTGAFLCARAAFGLMRRQRPQGGRIINNGSISAQTPRPNSAPYTATKHAITGLTKSLALDGRAYHIACSQLDIGNAGTDMTQTMRRGIAQADGSIRPEPTFDRHQCGKAVVYMANLPLEANILQMTLMATTMPLVGRG